MPSARIEIIIVLVTSTRIEMSERPDQTRYTVHLQGIRPRGSICEILKRELYRWISIEFFR